MIQLCGPMKWITRGARTRLRVPARSACRCRVRGAVRDERGTPSVRVGGEQRGLASCSDPARRDEVEDDAGAVADRSDGERTEDDAEPGEVIARRERERDAEDARGEC